MSTEAQWLQNARVTVWWGILVLSFCVFAVSSTATETRWRVPLETAVKWSTLTWTGSLIVGSKEGIAHIDADGKALWTRADLNNLAPFNVRAIAGYDAVLVSQVVSKIPLKSRLLVLDFATGTTRWETESTIGQNLGAYPIVDRGVVLFARDMAGVKGTKSGAYVTAYDLSSGNTVWQLRIGRQGTLPTHVSSAGGFIPVTDLSGHPQPVLKGDRFLLQAGNLFAIDLSTGSLAWEYKLKAHNAALKNAYAGPVVRDNTVYAVGQKSAVALDLDTGTERWKTKLPNATFPQLEVHDNNLIVRLGGTFSSGKKLVQAKPFGLAVLDTNSGESRWIWKKGKESLTNAVVLPQLDAVAVADKTRLHVFALNGSSAKPTHVEKLKFKRKMGKAELAAKGLGAVGGFLGGGISGGITGAMGGGDRSDPPVDLSVHGDNVVVRGQYHVLAFNPVSKQSPWSIQFAPPGVNAFALMAAGAVTTAVAVGSAQGAWAHGSSQGTFASNLNNLTGSVQKMAAQRFAASGSSREVAFFLTKEDGNQLVGIDLATGATVGRIPMAEKEPLFSVDGATNTVYFFAERRNLEAIAF